MNEALNAINAKYQAYKNILGQPHANGPKQLANGWWRQQYVYGAIYFKSGVGTFVVYGAICKLYFELKADSSFLGCPITDELPAPDNVGRYNHFEGGSIYWTPATGAHEVHGDIRAKWSKFGWEKSFLGYPLTNELATPDKIGRYNHFQGGSIYWTPTTKAFEVHGDIKKKWASLGWEKSFLGYPLTDEMTTPDKIGRYNHFQGGSIYWTPTTKAYEVHGDIRAKWSSLGWERSFLGYPVTDEMKTPDGKGRYNHFQGGSIYWTPKTGAHEVHGAIRAKWASLGWEKCYLGYPITDELATPDGKGRYNHFQGGSIYWHPNTGAYAIHDTIMFKYKEYNCEKGQLGYPVKDTEGSPPTFLTGNEATFLKSYFQKGDITWQLARNMYEVSWKTNMPSLF